MRGSLILEKVCSFKEISPNDIASLNTMAKYGEYGVKSVKVFQNKVCIEIEEEGNLKTYVVSRQWPEVDREQNDNEE